MGAKESLVLIVIAIISCCIAQPPQPPHAYEHEEDLSPYMSEGSYYHLYYNVSPPYLHACIIADTQDLAGYLGFGISTTGEMITSDAILGYLDGADFSPHVSDFILTGKLAPTPRFCNLGYPSACPDTGRNASLNCQDNLSLTNAIRTNAYLTVQFTRPLAASDPCDLEIPVNTPVHLVFTVGPVVFAYDWPYKAQYHSSYGNRTISFIYTPIPTTTGVPIPSSSAAESSSAAISSSASTTGATTGTTGVIPFQPPVLGEYTYFQNYTSNFKDPSTGNKISNYFGLYYTIANGNLSMGIVAEVPTDGWFSFGWSRDGFMATENQTNDVIIGWIDKASNPHIKDFNIKGRVAPSAEHCATNPIDSVCPDDTQKCTDDIRLLSTSKIGNYVTFKFTRKLDTGDACDIPIKPNVPQFIIYAVGPTTSEPWPYNVQFHDKYSMGLISYTFLDALGSSSIGTGTSTSVPTTTCPGGAPGCPCTQLGACVAEYQCINNVCVAQDQSSAIVLSFSLLLIAFLIL